MRIVLVFPNNMFHTLDNFSIYGATQHFKNIFWLYKLVFGKHHCTPIALMYLKHSDKGKKSKFLINSQMRYKKKIFQMLFRRQYTRSRKLSDSRMYGSCKYRARSWGEKIRDNTWHGIKNNFTIPLEILLILFSVILLF